MSGPHRNNNHRYTFRDHYPAEHLASMTVMSRTRLPRSLRILAWLLLVTFVMVALALVYVPWVQTSVGSGRVTTLDPRDRVQEFNALISGRVAEWYVRDGDSVRAGDLIVRIEDVDKSYVERLDAQLSASRRKHAAAREAVATANLDLKRREDLFSQGLTSRLDLEQAGIRVQQLRISEEQALSELNQAEVNLSRQGSQVVVAPRDGTILHVEASDVATIVSAGQALATFLPANTERAVEIFVDGRDVGLVRPGRMARIEFDGWPAFQFSGMPQYGVGTFSGEVVFVEPSARTDGRFRVLIRQPQQGMPCEPPGALPDLRLAVDCGWPPEQFVRLGAGARAWIVLETVPLGYEFWRLLNSFPPVTVAPLNTEARAPQ